MNWLALGIAVLVVTLWEFMMHWVPWALFFRSGQLGKVQSYVVGLAGIILAYAAWVWTSGLVMVDVWTAWWALVVLSVAGGAATVAAYGIDQIGAQIHDSQVRRMIDRENENDDEEDNA